MKSIHPAISVALMIAITVALATSIYVYVNSIQNDEPEEIINHITMWLVNYTTNDTAYAEMFNYSFEDEAGILLEFNISNDGETVDGHFEVRSYKGLYNLSGINVLNMSSGETELQTFVNEKEPYFFSPVGIAIEKVILWENTKNEKHSYLFNNLIYGNERYRVDVRFVYEKGIISFEPLYNITR